MWDVSKCDKCGDCLLMCQYVDYNREKAVRNIAELNRWSGVSDPVGVYHMHCLQRLLYKGCQSF